MTMLELLQQFYRFINMNFGPTVVIIFVLLTFVQISPIKINPWSKARDIFAKAAESIIKKAVSDISDKQDNLNKKQDEMLGMIKENSSKINELEKKSDMKDALDARRHIVSFNDEIMRNVRHTKDSFDTVMEDVKIYDTYTKKHEEFKNHITDAAMKNIMNSYQKCIDEHTFLGYT